MITPAGRRRSLRAAAGVVTLLFVLAVLASALAWRASGGRWFVVETPSMGQAAPVGTLLLTRDTTVSTTSVGDLVTFRSPGGQTYTHRVVTKTAAGLRTRGDINTVTDPWTLTDHDLIGTVVARWWVVGWALKALPLLLLGVAVTWTLAVFVNPRRRSAVRQLGTTLSISATSWWLHPWVGLEKLGMTTVANPDAGSHPTVAMRVVSTGILPIRVSDARGGPSVALQDGQAARVAFGHQQPGHGYNLDAALNLGVGWWVAVIAVCLAPLVWSLATAPAPTVDEASVDTPGTDEALESTEPAMVHA